MTEESQMIMGEAEEGMQKAIESLDGKFQKIRAGKASPQMLEGIKIDYYGSITPLDQAANINTPDPKQIIIQPWDKSMLPVIEKAIMAANLGFNPKNEGEILRIKLPPLTEERRRELVKKAKADAEDAKISIRNNRRMANDMAKSLEKEGVPEDEVKQLTVKIQEFTDKFIKKVDELMGVKEKDIMTI
jgi:ribosome recycling factor